MRRWRRFVAGRGSLVVRRRRRGRLVLRRRSRLGLVSGRRLVLRNLVVRRRRRLVFRRRGLVSRRRSLMVVSRRRLVLRNGLFVLRSRRLVMRSGCFIVLRRRRFAMSRRSRVAVLSRRRLAAVGRRHRRSRPFPVLGDFAGADGRRRDDRHLVPAPGPRCRNRHGTRLRFRDRRPRNSNPPGALDRRDRRTAIDENPPRDRIRGHLSDAREDRRVLANRKANRRDTYAGEPVDRNEHVPRLGNDDRRAAVSGIGNRDGRRDRRPADIGIAVAPRHPGRRPDRSGDPDPSPRVLPDPRSVVVRVAAPPIVRHPGPAIVGVDPFPVRVGLPADRDVARNPAVSPAADRLPPPVRRELVVEERHAHAHFGAGRARRKEKSSAENRESNHRLESHTVPLFQLPPCNRCATAEDRCAGVLDLAAVRRISFGFFRGAVVQFG